MSKLSIELLNEIIGGDNTETTVAGAGENRILTHWPVSAREKIKQVIGLIEAENDLAEKIAKENELLQKFIYTQTMFSKYFVERYLAYQGRITSQGKYKVTIHRRCNFSFKGQNCGRKTTNRTTIFALNPVDAIFIFGGLARNKHSDIRSKECACPECGQARSSQIERIYCEGAEMTFDEKGIPVGGFDLWIERMKEYTK